MIKISPVPLVIKLKRFNIVKDLSFMKGEVVEWISEAIR
jgi:hypothetical protein